MAGHVPEESREIGEQVESKVDEFFLFHACVQVMNSFSSVLYVQVLEVIASLLNHVFSGVALPSWLQFPPSPRYTLHPSYCLFSPRVVMTSNVASLCGPQCPLLVLSVCSNLCN